LKAGLAVGANVGRGEHLGQEVAELADDRRRLVFAPRRDEPDLRGSCRTPPRSCSAPTRAPPTRIWETWTGRGVAPRAHGVGPGGAVRRRLSAVA
jgi:hypothetical protein